MKSAYRANVFILLLMCVTLLGSLVFSFLYQVFDLVPAHWVRALLQYVLLFGGTTAFFLRITGLRLSGLGFRAPERPALSIPCTLLLAVLIQPPLLLISYLTSLIFPDPVAASMQQIVEEPFLLSVLGSALLPAVFEETACRGLYLTDLSDRRPLTVAALSGLVFGFLHWNLQQLPYAFCFGFVIALTALYTKSILLPMLAHFVINLSQLILAYRQIELFPDVRTLVTAAIICLPLVIGLLVLLRGKDPAEGELPTRFNKEWLPLLYAALLFAAVCILLR